MLQKQDLHISQGNVVTALSWGVQSYGSLQHV